LNTLFVGKNFLELVSVDSTNAFAQTLIPSHPTEGTVIMAQTQTAGRGQHENVWHSAPGQNLTFSLILNPTFLPAQKAFAISKLVSVALQQCLQAWMPSEKVEIKWPNDILVNRKKIAGILVENHLSGSGIRHSIIGIGLNVNQAHFPPHLPQATSMAMLAGRTFDLKETLNRILERMEALYLQLRAGRSSQMDFDYLQGLYGYGEHIPVEVLKEGSLPTGRQTVVLAGIDASGRLALEIDQGLHYFQMKEIAFCL